MNPLSLIVTTTVLVIGAGGVLIFGDFFPTKNNNKVLNATTNVGSVNNLIKNKVDQKEETGIKKAKSIIDDIVENIIESPILAPIVNTQKEVKQTVDTVKSLPVDQRNAICTQICGQ
ncbi:MAG: hypothetical protein A3H88_02190 [Candidatus Blackburnbacteria bacterium RIFCSPLOWO2_02_FULL_44_9]|uniref:Uncharacterized protein n=1 Tax=Candidatus Blackburnbacteria bacterium RIFCSPHIGHO2_02_FULL_44_20 TaxID=1797516 RepID=A0A1G1V9D2_9BACT|nr:MAG: hypothetical protein A3E16_01560 [Candidatus Blackburnbacteria bacterium RIFCSPHIGHO2_12_FULL_44_25]OGY11927.1 MAG: hypothetical protein A3D26_02970 [Candidatus Blackburnbacteria bacterium RIFCSPHIGHO2_02_FULL_44_20]OGY14048.1 MAG: hypothetical protein A3A62_02960 [Candidatus Blackburnbacteria bacterium RIFCSPLOWO2_01_FULL_44_43]OGY15379.1 MAG: hypothetical protein A3H88_02190 [Candidatus Blackburnbacteria bacterium RIFCSPLOWO2_02_FULL_44_9]